MRTCHVCGGENLSLWCPGLLECSICTHVQADVKLTDAELVELYSHKYFHGEEYVDYALERKALELNFARRLDQIKELVPSGRRLFEIGCAYGYFLHHAARLYQASGCDISQHAIAQAKQSGLNAVCADYLELPAPLEPYNIICLWDTIEHIANPKAYVEKAYQELAAGGCLIISTGDAGSRVARQRREKWRMVHPPTHLHYFTSDSACTMLNNAGFNRIRVTHDPFYRNMESSFKKIGSLATNPVIKTFSAMGQRLPVIKNLNFPLNLYDIMTVYGRR